VEVCGTEAGNPAQANNWRILGLSGTIRQNKAMTTLDPKHLAEISKTPAEAWQALVSGNRRFVEGTREHPHQDADRRQFVAAGQRPFAIVFGCSDSRVAAEIVFDRGLGDLFVVRTAGHILDSAVLGSLEFGVIKLEIPLLVVLGHDSCGAIETAMKAMASGKMPRGYIRDVAERVMPAVVRARPGAGSEETSTAHIMDTVQLIRRRSAAIARRIKSGHCAVIGVSYTLAEGTARLITPGPA